MACANAVAERTGFRTVRIVLTPPEDLPADLLTTTLARHWGVRAASETYRPLGFGSHHWSITDSNAQRWFVTVDELETKRHTADESLDSAFDRLHASLSTAAELRRSGLAFVVAPIPSATGEPVVRAGLFGIALYPFIDGQSYEWGDFPTPEHRHAVLDLVVAVHTAPESARRHALADDFAIPSRDAVEAALDRKSNPMTDIASCGPHAQDTATLIADNASALRAELARYDELTAEGHGYPSRFVLTHGEPHPGNTMLTANGYQLIDWDTALMAPPERDLWRLDPGDGSILSAYTEATGIASLPSMMELFRIRWDLADIAVAVSRFHRPHGRGADDEKSWEILQSLVTQIGS
jgi:Phosphotransferase enzyme family